MPGAPLFNPKPQIERLSFGEGGVCYVVDDALVEPERLVQWATANRARFQPVDYNAFPGTYLLPPVSIDDALRDFFAAHLRARFDARRVVDMHCRLAMVTALPTTLKPFQWLPHTDRAGVDRAQSIQASVLYLFRDTNLGGTSFYEPARSRDETAQLFADSASLGGEAFTERYGIEASYVNGSNRYFKRVASVPAKWNRAIFYDGSLLHSADISSPQTLSADPQTGRLTLNGFFVSRRRAA